MGKVYVTYIIMQIRNYVVIGWVIFSRAIIIYLVEKYGKNDQLYPKDAQKRAIVNRMLFFDVIPLNNSITQWIVMVKFLSSATFRWISFFSVSSSI